MGHLFEEGQFKLVAALDKKTVCFFMETGVATADSIVPVARAADIINANKLTDPSLIFVGQVLFIPGGK